MWYERTSKEVVLCRDCKWYHIPFDFDTQTGCQLIDEAVAEDEDYCSFGILKPDDDTDEGDEWYL